MKSMAIVDCPACQLQIEQPEESLTNGVKCPACGTGFMPADYRTVSPSTDPARTARKAGKLRSYAYTLHVIASCLVILAGGIIFFGLQSSQDWITPVGAVLGSAFFTELLAQIIYIRAAVEDIARK